MALSELDRNLLQRCLTHRPRAWEEFVNRFIGLVTHVIRHTAQCRSIRLSRQDVEDLTSEAFLTLIKDDFAVLRRFRGESSLANYLTVVCRRVIVRELLKTKRAATLSEAAGEMLPAGRTASPEERISDREQVEQLLSHLEGPEAEIVRLYHLEGKSYQEISHSVGMPENTIGPTLSRARAKMRRVGTSGN